MHGSPNAEEEGDDARRHDAEGAAIVGLGNPTGGCAIDELAAQGAPHGR